ncbi:hypothetical protein G7Z17_g2770 [Cylindrodendrum hubeiense]|uniref:Zn(2)-C6 fungal-type domain-containing protein n=1 Tax=Cylindrodendrum hubeiense TaxID=595255 RepID=A0A9P5LE45_9HYPO|nr:hypothetical protein G7Z17_g2770 [Cylindrodendrum hubeiense]
MASHPTRAITRNRDRLVCTECRRRKLKCDRSTPCSSCVRRGVPSSCEYRPSGGLLEEERGRRMHAEERLQHLEKLVNQLATQRSEATPAPSDPTSSGPDTSAPSSTAGYTEAAPDDMIYNGSTHWSAMLQDIQALRSAIIPDDPGDAEVEPPELTADTGIGLLFGAAPAGLLTFSEVLSHYLPSRQETDRLTAAYFRHKAIAAPFIHAAQFRRLYQAFWTSPATAPPLWTSLLFSICHVASNVLTHVHSSAADLQSPPSTQFSLASAHCLSLGCYFRPQPFAVEGLLLFAQAQCLTCLELSPDLGVLFGSLIRLTTQMGYHRDPDVHWSDKFTPFEGEMRRRTWSMAMQLDLLVAFHLGLPSNVQFPTWDTKAPRAIMNKELREDMAELPPEREDSTDILFYLIKHRFVQVFEKILRHVLSKRPPTSVENGEGQSMVKELDELDIEIRGVYATVPEDLQSRDMVDSVFDSPSTIVTRLCVSNLYHKCFCVLHRPYATLGRTRSVLVCLSSSRAIVSDMVDVYYEFAPGGQMETEMWFISSLSWHDFLIGATALCLALCKLKDGGEDPDSDIELLKRARDIFAEQAPRRAKDTKRVVAVIDTTIRHVMGVDTASGHSSAGSATDIVMTSADIEAVVQTAQLEESWAFGDFSTVAGPLEDPTWRYLEQMLDLEPQ